MRTIISPAISPARFAQACILAAALSAPALAEEAHRELGAHVHGHGTLNIAIEDKRVSMELEAPGMDIVGFEHAATTAAQKSAVEKAKTQLASPLSVLALPAAAACSLATADVKLESEHAHGDDHDHDAKDQHDHSGHDHDGKAKAKDAGGHNHFHVAYTFDCSNPVELTGITFDYFKQFAGAQGLTVNVVTGKGQSKYEVSRDKPTLDLGGIM
jgi:hypothetical protein